MEKGHYSKQMTDLHLHLAPKPGNSVSYFNTNTLTLLAV
jgi:hypothetical protein